MFVIGYSVCYWQALPAKSIVCGTKPGDYPRLKNLSRAHILGSLLALLANSRLDQEGTDLKKNSKNVNLKKKFLKMLPGQFPEAVPDSGGFRFRPGVVLKQKNVANETA
jgi:hypothetical protein